MTEPPATVEWLQAIGPIGIFAYLVIDRLLQQLAKKKEGEDYDCYANGHACAYNPDLFRSFIEQVQRTVDQLSAISREHSHGLSDIRETLSAQSVTLNLMLNRVRGN